MNMITKNNIYREHLSQWLAVHKDKRKRSEIIDQFARYDVDYVDVKGQEMAKRAVTVAAAGAHHLLI